MITCYWGGDFHLSYIILFISLQFSWSDFACENSLALPVYRESKEISSYELEYAVDNPKFFSRSHRQLDNLVKFQKEVTRLGIDLNPFSLIIKQKGIFQQSGHLYDAYFDQFLSEPIGIFSKIKCLNASLLNHHLQSFPPESEFMAIVFKKENRRHIWVTSTSHTAVSNPNFDKKATDMRFSGWQMQTIIHNHPFIFNPRYGDHGGTTIPSETDVKTFQNLHLFYGLQEAIITNGFDEIKLSASDFYKIKLIDL